MATADTQTDYTCDHCGGPRPPDRVEAGYAYCSERCYRNHRWAKRGNELLNKIVNREHKFCGTCFRRLKHVDRSDYLKGVNNPKDIYRRAPKNFRGVQTLTHHAGPTERETVAIDQYQTLVKSRPSGCECGTTKHRDVHNFLRAIEDDDATARRLFEAVADTAERKEDVPEPDRDLFEAGWQEGGAALAAGMACYG